MDMNTVKTEKIDEFSEYALLTNHNSVQVKNEFSPPREIGAPLSELLGSPVKDEFVPLEYLGNILNNQQEKNIVENTAALPLEHRNSILLSALAAPLPRQRPEPPPQAFVLNNFSPIVFVQAPLVVAPSIVPINNNRITENATQNNIIKVEHDSDCEIVAESHPSILKSALIQPLKCSANIYSKSIIPEVIDLDAESETMERENIKKEPETMETENNKKEITESQEIIRNIIDKNIKEEKTENDSVNDEFQKELQEEMQSENKTKEELETATIASEINGSQLKVVKKKLKVKLKKKLKDKEKLKKKKQRYPPKSAQTLSCKLCPYTTVDKSNFKKHTIARHTDKTEMELLQCPHCPYQAKIKENLQKHQRIHSDIVLQCNRCPFYTKYPQVLEKHKLVNHLQVKGHQFFGCAHCPAMFRNKNSLIHHLNIHRGTILSEEIFKCDKCPFTTKQKGGLDRHQIKHLPSKYFCEKCPYETPMKLYLKKHLQKSHQLKVYRLKDLFRTKNSTNNEKNTNNENSYYETAVAGETSNNFSLKAENFEVQECKIFV